MASLAEALYGLPAERLRTLVQLRNIEPKKLSLIATKRHLVQLLSQELTKPASVAAAVLRCNARELRLLQLIVSCENNNLVAWTRLLETVGGEDLRETIQPLIERLETLGLVFSVSRGLMLASGVTQQVPVSLPDRFTLVDRLNTYDLPSLKAIRDKLRLDSDAETKNAIVEAVRAHLLEGGPGLRLKTPLTEEEIETLEYIVQCGGSAQAVEVVSALQHGRLDDFFRYDWTNRWKKGQERNAIDSLLARGILHTVAQNYGFNIFLLIPGDMMRVLTQADDRAFWQEPAPVPMPLAEPPVQSARHALLCRDVVAFLGFLAMQEAARTNTGHIHRTSLKNAARLLSLADDRYAAFVYAVCREAGLIAPQGAKQVYGLTTKGNQWLHWDALAQTRLLYEAWRGGDVWAEMDNEPLAKAGDYRPKDRILLMRQAALEVVSEATQDAFYEADSLTDTMNYRCPLLLAQSGMYGLDLVASPASFVRLLIGECLFWLGIAEIYPPVAPPTAEETAAKSARGAKPKAASKAESPGKELAFRLTPLGRYLLELPGANVPEGEPREDKFIVQANAEIFVPPFLDPATLYRLLSFTEVPAKGSTGNVVTLTREAIRRALDRGETARDVIAFLQGHARTGIPQNVEYLINEVGGKHGHIHIGQAQMYIQVDSPILLKELEARKELKPYFVRALSDTVALLKGDEPEKLLRELRKAGYLPVSDDDTVPTAFKEMKQPASPTIRTATMPQDRESKRAAKADTVIDWDRIAQEDGQPYSTAPIPGAKGKAPTGAVTQSTLISFLIKQAVRSGQCVEIAYKDQGESSSLHVIEPQRVTGNAVIAYSRTADLPLSFELTLIQWARLTQEMFR